MSGVYWTAGLGFIGIHVGWYMLQQNYVPEDRRHDHPFIRYYKSYMKQIHDESDKSDNTDKSVNFDKTN